MFLEAVYPERKKYEQETKHLIYIHHRKYKILQKILIIKNNKKNPFFAEI